MLIDKRISVRVIKMSVYAQRMRGTEIKRDWGSKRGKKTRPDEPRDRLQ